MASQIKLLRILQEKKLRRSDGAGEIALDIRILASTNLDLQEESRSGRFRQDLYYRLNVVALTIPPLRDRREDIPLLFQHFVQSACTRYGRQAPPPSASAFDRLMAHDWPGNVRELKHTADRFVLGLGLLDNTPDAACESSALSLPERVDLFEKVVLEAELGRHKGSVAATIDALGLPRKTFYDKLKKHGITRAEFSEPSQT